MRVDGLAGQLAELRTELQDAREDRRSLSRAVGGLKPIRRASVQNVAAASLTRRTSPSRTSRARLDDGNSLPVSGSRTSGIPSSTSKNSRCSSMGHVRRMFFRELLDDAVTNR